MSAMKTMLRILFGAVFIILSGCENDCKDDADCLFVPDGQGGHYEEIDVEDGKCECA